MRLGSRIVSKVATGVFFNTLARPRHHKASQMETKMRVPFEVPGGSGHSQPLNPFADGLRAEGHELTFPRAVFCNTNKLLTIADEIRIVDDCRSSPFKTAM